MVGGYTDFPDDVALVFSDTITQFGFVLASSSYDTVVLKNDKLEVTFSIVEDSMIMSLTRSDKVFKVTDLVTLIDKDFYFKWKQEREAASLNLSRENYYKSYLVYYHQLSDKFLLNTYATGLIPMEDEHDKMKINRDEYIRKYRIAWSEMQKLDLNHPIRQKYIYDDPAWVDEMLDLMKSNHNGK